MTRVIVGAGGQGRVILENWRAAEPDARFVFVDDDAALHGTTILGAVVVGATAMSVELARAGAEVVLAFGNNKTRLAVADRLTAGGLSRWGTVIHPSAVVMPSATLGQGTVVFAGAVVNTGARLGEHVVVNTGVIVEHDSVVGRGASLSPGSRSGGRIEIGEGAFLATGVTVAPRVRVGAWAVVGAGAVVVRDIPERVLAFGVPARVVGGIDDAFDWQRLL